MSVPYLIRRCIFSISRRYLHYVYKFFTGHIIGTNATFMRIFLNSLFEGPTLLRTYKNCQYTEEPNAIDYVQMYCCWDIDG